MILVSGNWRSNISLPYGFLIDTYNATRQFQYPQVVAGLSGGPHQIAIITAGTHNPNSTGNLIVVDGFSIP